MEYRKAVCADISSLIKMRIAYLTADFNVLSNEQIDIISSQLHNYFEKHLNHDLFAYICTDQASIVATAFMLVIEKPASPSFITGKVGMMLNVYTYPAYRRRGIAKTLMENAIQDAKTMALSYIELQATEDGIPLYQGLGFVEEESRYVNMKLDL